MLRGTFLQWATWMRHSLQETKHHDITLCYSHFPEEELRKMEISPWEDVITSRVTSVWNRVTVQWVTIKNLHPVQPAQNYKKSMPKTGNFKSQCSPTLNNNNHPSFFFCPIFCEVIAFHFSYVHLLMLFLRLYFVQRAKTVLWPERRARVPVIETKTLWFIGIKTGSRYQIYNLDQSFYLFLGIEGYNLLVCFRSSLFPWCFQRKRRILN